MLIVEFEWDDTNIRHLGRHGLDADQVNAMLNSRITVIRNRKAGSGEYKFIGKAQGGDLLTIVVARTAVPGRWRPVTGAKSTNAEATQYGR